jgi:hypothetical protein
MLANAQQMTSLSSTKSSSRLGEITKLSSNRPWRILHSQLTINMPCARLFLKVLLKASPKRFPRGIHLQVVRLMVHLLLSRSHIASTPQLLLKVRGRGLHKHTYHEPN